MYEYDLVLNADVNSTGRQQWFYFRISGEGVCSSTTYTFNIINLEKQRTLFNLGFTMFLYFCSILVVYVIDTNSSIYP